MVNAKELGKLKLEHKVGKGIFITNKTYCIIDNNNKYINKEFIYNINYRVFLDYRKDYYNNKIYK